MRIFAISILYIFIDSVAGYAQSTHKYLRNGDMLYGFGKYSEAETEYRRAETQKPSLKSAYNLGNTLMNQERYEEAIKKYQDAADKATTEKEKASVYHNLGNALYKKQQYRESIEAYKKSLKYQPKDIETKENLAISTQRTKKATKPTAKGQRKSGQE
jgi:Ca-activated chloride channel family protein